VSLLEDLIEAVERQEGERYADPFGFDAAAAGSPDAQHRMMQDALNLGLAGTVEMQHALICAEMWGRMAASQGDPAHMRGLAGVLLLAASYWGSEFEDERAARLEGRALALIQQARAADLSSGGGAPPPVITPPASRSLAPDQVAAAFRFAEEAATDCDLTFRQAWDFLTRVPDHLLPLLETPRGWQMLASDLCASVGVKAPTDFIPTQH